MTNLEYLLEEGTEGAETDVERSVSLQERAIAEDGDVWAMYNLAYILEHGRGGVQKDVERAIAEGGNVYAMTKLGNHFSEDRYGVEKNVEQPVSLYERVKRKLPRIPDDVVVFISHSGEQKRAVAHSLRECLESAGFLSFLDVKDLQVCSRTVSEQLNAAMRYCNVAVFVLSPEFVAKKWPMLELCELLKLRRKAREEGKPEPLLFPLFFALTVEECKDGPLLLERYAEVFEKEGFFDDARQRKCSTEDMVAAVDEVARYPGLVYKRVEGMSMQEFLLQAAVKVSKSSRLGLQYAS